MFMASEGTIEIELAEFWGWVQRNHPAIGEIAYGVPRVNKSNQTIEIDYAASTDGHPAGWAKKPEALKQWEDKSSLQWEKIPSDIQHPTNGYHEGYVYKQKEDGSWWRFRLPVLV